MNTNIISLLLIASAMSTQLYAASFAGAGGLGSEIPTGPVGASLVAPAPGLSDLDSSVPMAGQKRRREESRDVPAAAAAAAAPIPVPEYQEISVEAYVFATKWFNKFESPAGKLEIRTCMKDIASKVPGLFLNVYQWAALLNINGVDAFQPEKISNAWYGFTKPAFFSQKGLGRRRASAIDCNRIRNERTNFNLQVPKTRQEIVAQSEQIVQAHPGLVFAYAQLTGILFQKKSPENRCYEKVKKALRPQLLMPAAVQEALERAAEECRIAEEEARRAAKARAEARRAAEARAEIEESARMSVWAYGVLGLAQNASGQDIRNAYLNLSRTRHPDKGGTKERFQELNLAHEVASKDAELRLRR